MAGKNQHQSSAPHNEISTIRSILMGEQMAGYAEHFAKLEKEITANKDYFSNELSSLGHQTDARIQRLEKDMNERFDRLEQLLKDHVARLDQKLLEVTTTDKQNLGQMLAELSSKLIQQDK